NEVEPMFSPDGRWIAYLSNESGRNEVFVRPFPGPGGKWQVSTGGGDDPTWARTPKELLYRGPGNRILAPSDTIHRGSFQAYKPRGWSEQAIGPRARPPHFFDLHPDGERIVAAVPSGQAEEKLDKVTFIFTSSTNCAGSRHLQRSEGGSTVSNTRCATDR